MEILQDAHFWEGVGLALLVALFVYLKAPQAALGAIDKRTSAVKDRLAEASRLRDDAERLLAEIKTRREATEHQAAEVMALARAEAERLTVDSHAKLEDQIRRRTDQAERRIALAESQAAAEVRAAAADLAARAAEAVLAARLAGSGSDPLIDQAVARLPSKFQ